MAAFGKEAAQLTNRSLKRYALELNMAALEAGFPSSLVAAIISRETAGLRIYCEPPPVGRLGDGGHGHGPMQVDDRSFPAWCKDWRDGKLKVIDGIRQGCQVLKMKRAAIAKLIPELPEGDRLRASVAAYNCGEGNVKKAFLAQKELDVYTTGKDYAKDVLARAEYFAANDFKG